MREIAAFVIAIAMMVPAYAQRRGGGMHGGFGGFRGGGGGGAMHGGFGHGGFRGGGRGWSGRPVFRGGGFRGFGYRNYYRPYGFGFGLGYGAGYWPAFYDGFGYGGLGYYEPLWDASAPMMSAPVYYYAAPPAPAAAAPVVIINQTPPPPVYEQSPRYREPSENAETPPAAPEREPYQPTRYQIVFKDHHTVPALAYWIKDGTLHYVTPDFAMKAVPASSVEKRLRELPNHSR